MRVDFIKCHGTSNDFVLIDERGDKGIPDRAKPVVAKTLCSRDGPVGADGILYVSDSPAHDVRMRMFNPDGSESENCANGLRCVARFMFDTFESTSGTIEIAGGWSVADRVGATDVYTVRVSVGPFFLDPKDFPTAASRDVGPIALPRLSPEFAFFAASAPNPHLIAFVDGTFGPALTDLGQRIEAGIADLPNRSNLSFVKVLRPNEVFMRTFERGAGITQSCGSAMASAALAYYLSQPAADKTRPITIYTDGGSIRASLISDDDTGFKVELVGNATFEYSGSITVDTTTGTASEFLQGPLNSEEISAFNKVYDAARLVGENT